MENPYDKFGAHPCEVKAGRTTLWVFTVLFLLGIAVPPVLRNLQDAKKTTDRWVPALEFWNHPNPKGRDLLRSKKQGNSEITRTQPSLRDHLQAVEKEIKGADFRESIRAADQRILTSLFHEGNSKAVIGKDGWFFYQPGIDGLAGYGPLKSEPDSVTKDPDRAQWFPQAPVIEKFAAQLKERGVELMLVPVPVKPMIHPEHLASGTEAPVRHRDQEKLYQTLRDTGIEVVDLTDAMLEWKKEGEPLYLKQDTHWTQNTMRRAAAEVAARVKAKAWFSDVDTSLKPVTEVVTRSHGGDLVGMLDIAGTDKKFPAETQEITRVLDPATKAPIASDPESPIALLGDSFVNVFDTPQIGFGNSEKDTEPIGGGFAGALAQELGTKLDIHTANGGGATDVRKSFAGSSKDVVAKKKLVIWTIASRDLLLSETPGGKAGVRWRDVEFSERENGVTEPFTMVGTLKERSSLGDPTSTPYEDSIFSALFDVEAIDQGSYSEDEAMVFLWGFKKRILEPESELQVGDKVQLELTPLSSNEELKGINMSDDLFADLPQMFSARTTVLSKAGGETSMTGFLIFAGVLIAYFSIGLTMQMRERKKTANVDSQVTD